MCEIIGIKCELTSSFINCARIKTINNILRGCSCSSLKFNIKDYIILTTNPFRENCE